MQSSEPVSSNNFPKSGIFIHSSWPNLAVWQKVFLIFIAFVISTECAFNTSFDVHPDERMHYDAFRYYEQNWWPPDIGSDDILYSPHGWSRLYTGETVYFFYGKIGGLIKSTALSGIDQQSKKLAVLPYRFLNILLFICTLAVLLFTRFRRFQLSFIAYTLLVIPQIYYIYSYANSDAWGISLGIFLFVLANKMTEKDYIKWSWFDISLLAVLTGLIMTAKINFFLLLILPYLLLAIHLYKNKTSFNKKFIVWTAIRIFYVALIVFLFYSPFEFVYKGLQGDFESKKITMIQEKARPWYKPDVKEDLADQGETYLSLVINHPFLQTTYNSFIGVFGYFTVWLPNLFYIFMGILILASLLLTIISFFRYWNQLEIYEILTVLISPVVIGLNLFGSMHYSLHSTYQAQGRYLFASIIPFAFVIMGTINEETGNSKFARITISGLMYFLCLISLLILLSNGELRS